MEAVTAGEDMMAQAIAAFVPLLEKRLSAGIFTTEDSVRYTFFAALLQAGVAPEQVVLEAPYPNTLEVVTERKQLDLLLYNPDKEQVAAMEFKYNRAIPSGKSARVTAHAGKLFADLSRLLLWHDPIARYFIYLTDRAMYNYLCKAGNKVPAIFTLAPNQDYPITVASFNHPAAVFHTAMGQWTHQASLRVLANADLPNKHHLWIFSIQPTTGD